MLTKIKVNCLVVVVNPFPWRLKLAVLVRILCPACPEVVSSSLPPIPSLSHHPSTVALKNKDKDKEEDKKEEEKSSYLPPIPSLSHHPPTVAFKKEKKKAPPSLQLQLSCYLQKIKKKKKILPPAFKK